MKLIASMNTYNELGRYLTATVPQILTYCDELRVQDDGSTDGTYEWLQEQDRVEVKRAEGVSWREHEGYLHQALLQWTFEGNPTHILAIDADEVVPRGDVLRATLAVMDDQRSFAIRMCEVWDRRKMPWFIRTDGGWVPHPVAITYQAPDREIAETNRNWWIWGRKMAGGRVPRMVRLDQRSGRVLNVGGTVGIDILHLGWSRPEEREKRYQRYMELDGGNFHASAHLDSIMWPNRQCTLERYDVEEPLHTLFRNCDVGAMELASDS